VFHLDSRSSTGSRNVAVRGSSCCALIQNGSGIFPGSVLFSFFSGFLLPLFSPVASSSSSSSSSSIAELFSSCLLLLRVVVVVFVVVSVYCGSSQSVFLFFFRSFFS
jgi:hypothetical protein